MTPMKFTYDGWDYKILDAEKNEENVVEVTGVITMKDVGGRVVFDFTYGCDKDVYECHVNQARSRGDFYLKHIKNDDISGICDDIGTLVMKKVIKKGSKLRDEWQDAFDVLDTPGGNKTDDFATEEEFEEEELKRPKRTSSGISDTPPSQKRKSAMSASNLLTSISLKVQAKNKKIEEAKKKRESADQVFRKYAKNLTDFSKMRKGTQIGATIKSLTAIRDLKSEWTDYSYGDDGHCLHDLAQIMRSVADVLDSKNSDVETLEREKEELTTEWLKARRKHTDEQFFMMTGKMPDDR